MGHRVIGYDIFFPLVNFWQVLLGKKSQLIEKLSTLKLIQYNEIKETLLCWSETQKLLKDWKTDYYKREPIYLSDVDAAAYYFFNHNLSYGPLFLGWLSKNSNEIMWERMLEKLLKFECPNLTVGLSGFADSLPRHKNDFLYLDPPYFLDKDEDNKMFSGIYPNRNFPVHHDSFDHNLLCEILKKHKGGFVLSYNNCESIRTMYSNYTQVFPRWFYSLGNGETRRDNNVKESHEILILSEPCNTLCRFFEDLRRN